MLLALLIVPFVAAGLMMLASGRDVTAALRLSLSLAGVILLGSLYLAVGPDVSLKHAWFSLPSSGAETFFALEWDGLSRWLVVLVTALTPIALLGGRGACGDRLREFAAGIFMIQGCLIGAFLAADLVLFYLFFEAMLIPTAILVALFGDADRRQAIMRFVLYTMAGSALFLVAIWYMVAQIGTSYLPDMIAQRDMLPVESLPWLFVAVCFAFVVKTPLYPFHSWQVPIYGTCPAGIAVLVAGVMAKLGPYGFLRIVLPLFPEHSQQYQWAFIILGLIGVVGGAAMALVQSDLKKILAYSSLSHLGLMIIGVFAFDQAAASGAVLQMIAHGLVAAALFLLVGGLEQRTGSRQIQDFGGIAQQAPLMAVIMVATALAAVALPGTAAFAGEFLLLAGTYNGLSTALSGTQLVIVFILAGSGLILGAGYTLRVIQRVTYGPLGAHKIDDVNRVEGVALGGLLAASLFLGIRPGVVLDHTEGLIPESMIEQVAEIAHHSPDEHQSDNESDEQPQKEDTSTDPHNEHAHMESESVLMTAVVTKDSGSRRSNVNSDFLTVSTH